MLWLVLAQRLSPARDGAPRTHAACRALGSSAQPTALKLASHWGPTARVSARFDKRCDAGIKAGMEGAHRAPYSSHCVGEMCLLAMTF